MYRVNSVSKALAILDLMLTNQHDMSLGAITRALDINESTASHLVSTLVTHGYLKQRKKYGKYSLGVRFLEINDNNDSGTRKRKETIGYIVELSRLLNEAVHLIYSFGTAAIFSPAELSTIQMNRSNLFRMNRVKYLYTARVSVN